MVKVKLSSDFKYKFDKYWDHLVTLVPELSTYKENIYIAGGSIATDLQTGFATGVHDFDLYFNNNYTRDKVTTLLQENKQTILNGCELNIRGFNVWSETDNAITIPTYKPLQFITKYTGKPEELIQKFDFLHCMNYCDIINFECYITDLDSIKKQVLKVNKNLHSPFSAFIRTFKFIERGYEFPLVEKYKLALQLNSEKFEKENVENLTGMYSSKEEKQLLSDYIFNSDLNKLLTE